jgi:hypothetical protein
MTKREVCSSAYPKAFYEEETSLQGSFNEISAKLACLGKMPFHKRIILFAATLFFSACNNPVPQNGHSETSALVTPQEFRKAEQIIAGIDYIPFDFPDDGCYARALYMSMELAAQKIPSSAQFVFPTDDNKPLRVGEVEWGGGHVAPVLYSKNKAYILDRSLSPGPITREKWLQIMGRVPIKLLLVPGSVYGFSVIIDPNEPIEGVTSNKIIKSFDELLPFNLGDIRHAFRTMHKYIRYEAELNNKLSKSKPDPVVLEKRTRDRLAVNASTSLHLTPVPNCI